MNPTAALLTAILGQAVPLDRALVKVRASGAAPDEVIQAIRDVEGVSLARAREIFLRSPAWAGEAQALGKFNEDVISVLRNDSVGRPAVKMEASAVAQEPDAIRVAPGSTLLSDQARTDYPKVKNDAYVDWLLLTPFYAIGIYALLDGMDSHRQDELALGIALFFFGAYLAVRPIRGFADLMLKLSSKRAPSPDSPTWNFYAVIATMLYSAVAFTAYLNSFPYMTIMERKEWAAISTCVFFTLLLLVRAIVRIVARRRDGGRIPTGSCDNRR